MLLALAADAAAEELKFPKLKPGDSLAVSMPCAGNTGVESKTVPGPGGLAAALVIYSHDDYSKNSHACEAGYHVLVAPDQKLSGQPYDGFMGSDNDWHRPLSGKLFGFSADGHYVFGSVTEGGRFPFTVVFAFAPRTGHHLDVNITRQLPLLRAAHCGSSFAVIGMTAGGNIVLAPDTAHRCRVAWRWQQDLAAPKGSGAPRAAFHQLPASEKIVPLYEPPARQGG